MEIIPRGSLLLKAKRPGFRRGGIFMEVFRGSDPSQQTPSGWAVKDRVIDRDNDYYLDHVIDPDTGHVLHHDEGRLSEHRGHGSTSR